MSHRRIRRSGIIAAGAMAGVLALAVPALAHVRVTPEKAEGGGFEKLTFRVPNESDSASTTKLTVQIPEEMPLASVSVQPVPGWKAEPKTTKLKKPVNTGEANLTEAVTSITWTAEKGAEIGPGEFQEFAISGGPLPDKGRLTLPTEQTYSDGEVVKWDEATTEGGAEPEHPAPYVDLTPAADGHGHGGGMAKATPAPAAAVSSGTTGGDDSGTRNLAIAGLVAGVIGLLAGIGGLIAGRRGRAQ